MLKSLAKYTLIWSFALGALLAVLLFGGTKEPSKPKRLSLEQNYEAWFRGNNLKRTVFPMDTVRYGSYNKDLIESKYLFDHVKVLCVVLVRKSKNAAAANNTWAQSCNGRSFIRLQPEKVQKTMLPIRREKIVSSWLFLCDAIRKVTHDYQWTIFLYDDTFALIENVRYMVAGLDPDEGHYLGHAITFWGVTYNVGQAGYVLSRGTVKALQDRFNSSEACIAGGRFWKQEDFYLGKHLSAMNITPKDTRDSKDLSTFHGYNLAQLLFPGALPQFANYYKHSVYPVRCCSPHSVTFQSVESDKMYTNYYMIYGVQLFDGGRLGNARAPAPRPDTDVWMAFLREQGITDMSISAEKYYELWKGIVDDPILFNQNIRNWSAPHSATGP